MLLKLISIKKGGVEKINVFTALFKGRYTVPEMMLVVSLLSLDIIFNSLTPLVTVNVLDLYKEFWCVFMWGTL